MADETPLHAILVLSSFAPETMAAGLLRVVSGDESFGQVIATNKNNTVVLVSQPADSDGAIYVFVRGTESGSLSLSQKIVR